MSGEPVVLHEDLIEFDDGFIAGEAEKEAEATEKKTRAKRPSQMGQIKPGFIAILGSGYVEAKSKRDLRKLLDQGGHQDAVIIRGKIVPTCRVTKLSF